MANKFLAILSLLIFLSCQKNKILELSHPQGGDFSIATTKGIYTTKFHRNKIIFVFFGFTHCPKICPMTLSSLHRMTKLLSEKERENVEVLFISVDPARDTMPVLTERMKNYSERFFAGVDTEENLVNLMNKFGASYKVYRGEDPDDIAIDHTTDIFLINGKGEWVKSIKFDSTPEELLMAYKAADQMSSMNAKKHKTRKIEVIGENTQCDVALKPCQLGEYELSLSPLPIVAAKTYTVTVKALTKNVANPTEIDFEGLEQNMGYIRPILEQQEDQTYKASFYIPSCDLPRMNWKAKLILGPSEAPKALIFHFSSQANSL
jgi:protein SCO1/2